MDQTVSGEGKRSQDLAQGCWSDRGFMLVLKGSLIMHVSVNLESVKFVLTIVSFNLYQPKRRKRTVCAHFLCHHVGVIEGRALSVAACVANPVSILCVCPCVCVSGRCAQLCCWLNMQTGKQYPRPSAWDGDPRYLDWAPAARQKEFLDLELL